MSAKKPRKRKLNPEYQTLLAGLEAARTPLAARRECAVFGCRLSDRDPGISFHSLPEDPQRLSEWLKLINRLDLAGKLVSGRRSAQVCSAHFPPGSRELPSLLLPTTNHEFVYADGGPQVEIKAEVEGGDATVEIKFEPEQPPTFTFHDEPTSQPNQEAQASQPVPTGQETKTQQTEPAMILNQPEITQSLICQTVPIFREPIPQFNEQQTQICQSILQTRLEQEVSPAVPHFRQANSLANQSTRQHISLSQLLARVSHFVPPISQPVIQLGQSSAQVGQFRPQLMPVIQVGQFASEVSQLVPQIGQPIVQLGQSATQVSQETSQLDQFAPQLSVTTPQVYEMGPLCNQTKLADMKRHTQPRQLKQTKQITELIKTSTQVTITQNEKVEDVQPVQFYTPSTLSVEIERADVKADRVEPSESFADQINVGIQTNKKEAFYRIASFSAVEQINIPPAPRFADIKKRSVHAQTTPELIDFFTIGLKRKLGEELEEANKKLKLIEAHQVEKTQFLKGCDKYLDEKMANFVKSHAYLANKFEGTNYPPEFMAFALNLYLRNPSSYKFVEQFFCLPSRRILQQYRVPVRSGINENLMGPLKVKVDQMSEKSKMCVVCFDVMCLKKNLYYDVTNDYLCGMMEIDQVPGTMPAEYAAVIMVRGLYSRWKQPLTFALLSEKCKSLELKAWLIKTISVLFDIGLAVKALVTNLEEECLDISVDETKLYFEVNGRKIYQMYDVPRLFRIVRDELIENDMHIGKAVAKWDHVLSVYDSDKEQELKLMPNITDKHVRPDSVTRKDVKSATQIFSGSVAAAMHFHLIARKQNKRTKDTVQFITKMSNLFGILYSRTLVSAYRASSTQQRFLKDALEYLKSLQLCDRDGNFIQSKFVPGLTITIKSVMALMIEQKKSNVNYILTKNLSKDCMQAFFDEIRLGCERLTPIKFIRVFRRLYLGYLLSDNNANATEDSVLMTLNKIAEYVKEDLDKTEPRPEKNLVVGVSDYKISWPSTEYISGYLLWKCLEQHSCEILVKNLCTHYDFKEENIDILLQTFQCYNAENVNKSLTKPPKQLIQFVSHIEMFFNEYFNRTNRQCFGFGNNILLIMKEDSFELLCPCFPLNYLKMLYIRLRIFSNVKAYNMRLKNR